MQWHKERDSDTQAQALVRKLGRENYDLGTESVLLAEILIEMRKISRGLEKRGN